MHKILRLFIVIWLTQGTSYAQYEALKPLTILISIDGFKPEYLNRGHSKTLLQLGEQGLLAKGLQSTFPSITFPNHYSIVTGLHADHHGIVNNTMYDPQIPNQVFMLSSPEAITNPKWWTEAEPIWITLSKHNKTASTLFWPGTEVSIQGKQPMDWLPYEHSMTSIQRVDKLLSWLDRPATQRADFVTLYFSEVDTFGHGFGPNSNEVNGAVQRVDDAIHRLIKGLEQMNVLKNTSLVIVSDHGMAEVPNQNQINGSQLTKQYPHLKWEWLGPLAGFQAPKEQRAEILKTLSTEPRMKCWEKSALPQSFNFGTHRRIPDIVCLADIGWTISANINNKTIPGQHGYNPNEQDMHGLLIVNGPRIKPQAIGIAQSIDVYLLLCELLSIPPHTNDASRALADLISH
jgi:predicted AlkP superfamily pyrophosphatase or phosphodiesterase